MPDVMHPAPTPPEFGPADGPRVPWPSDFELEVRRELSDIRAHQLRQDGLLMTLQLELRQTTRQIAENVARLLKLLVQLNSNGDSHG